MSAGAFTASPHWFNLDTQNIGRVVVGIADATRFRRYTGGVMVTSDWRGSPALSLFFGAFLCVNAWAQPYPNRPIRFISFGGSDAVPRIIGQRITESLGVQVINEVRGGASGTVGAELVARAPADGYTFAIGTSSLMTAPHFYKVTYDVARDFAPVSLLASTPWVLVVNAALPVRDVRSLIALARARPGQLDYGGPSPGSSGHLIVEMFKYMAGVNIVHVPYKTQSAQIIDLIGGQVSIGMMVAPLVIPQMKAGKLRGLAVTTAKRSAVLPELPTIAEAGVPDFAAPGWYALLGPAGTPPAVISTLHNEITRALKHPELLALFAGQALEPLGSTPQELGEFIRVELARWSKVIKDANIRVDPAGLPL